MAGSSTDLPAAILGRTEQRFLISSVEGDFYVRLFEQINKIHPQGPNLLVLEDDLQTGGGWDHSLLTHVDPCWLATSRCAVSRDCDCRIVALVSRATCPLVDPRSWPAVFGVMASKSLVLPLDRLTSSAVR